MSRSHTRSTSTAIIVDVSDRQTILRVSARWLTRIVRDALLAEGIDRAEIGLSLVNDRQISAIHRRWLGVAGPTDVITFDLTGGRGPGGRGPGGRAALVGDLVVSVETARRMARAAGWTPHREVAYYVVHGLLHLTGHDDHAPADRRTMRARERAVMRACGLPPPPRTTAGVAAP